MRGWHVAAVMALLATTAIERPARADLVYELAPTVGAGATSNVYNYSNYSNDPAAQAVALPSKSSTRRSRPPAAPCGCATKATASSTGLGLRAIYTQYLIASAPNTFTGNLGWDAGWKLSALWTLRLLAGASFTRTNGNDFGDPATTIPRGLVASPVPVYYLTTSASEDVAYEPSPRRGYGETFSVSQLRYFQSMQDAMQNMQGGVFVPLPTTDVFMLALRANRMVGRENYTLEVGLGDAYTETDPTMPRRHGHPRAQLLRTRAGRVDARAIRRTGPRCCRLDRR